MWKHYFVCDRLAARWKFIKQTDAMLSQPSSSPRADATAATLAGVTALVALWREEYSQPYGQRVGNRALLECADDIARILQRGCVRKEEGR